MKVNDTRTTKLNQIMVGDFLVSDDNELFVIADISQRSGYQYGYINIRNLILEDAEDTMEELLESFENRYFLKEIISQDRMSINIS